MDIALLLVLAPFQAAPNPDVAGSPVGAPPVAAAQADPLVDGEAGPAATPPVERYRGSFSEGAAELQRLALEGDTDAALAVSDALLVPGPLAGVRSSLERATNGLSERALARVARPLEWLGLPADEAAVRAEVHYARGLVYAQRAELEPSKDSFELARVLAGPGRTRLDAVYNQGTLDLVVGETLRQMIPEIAGENATQPPEGMEEDPLEVARAMYLAARERFVERLSSDWRDADTQANVELVLRRLEELDQVERQREEQEQQEQEDQEQDQEEGEQQDSDQQQSDSEEQDSSEQQDEGEEQESEQDEEQDPEESEESEDSEEQQESEDSSEEQQAQAQPDEEQHLTDEEVKRLLERLQQLDEKGEELRERLRGVRRVPVKRDW